MGDLESAARDIIAECGDDYVGLWSIIRRVRTAGIKDYPKLRTTAISLLKELLRHREIVAGQFRNGLFEQWHGSDEEVLE
jgi:hypothetical protein